MAHNRPWYQRNGGDFVMGTLHMPIEARLAYSLIIDMLNDRDMPLPDDADFICGFTKLSKRMWAKARAFLLSDLDANGNTRLYIDDRGMITNPRFERERQTRADQREVSAEAGRKGGKKSAAMRATEQPKLDFEAEKTPKSGRKDAEKTPKSEDKSGETQPNPNENNDLGQPPPQARAYASARQRPETRDREEEESASTALALVTREGVWAAKEFSDHLCRIGGIRNLDPNSINRHEAQVREWLEAGADPPMIATIVQNGRDRAVNGLHSLKYFDPKIRQAIARRDHPNGNATDEIRDPLLREYLAGGGALR